MSIYNNLNDLYIKGITIIIDYNYTLLAVYSPTSDIIWVWTRGGEHLDSERHNIQAVELSQRSQTAVQIVSNIPACFMTIPAMRTRGRAGVAPHKSG